MDRARAEAERLKSWKFYVRRYPWVAAGALAGIAYVMVPKRRRRVIVERHRQPLARQQHENFGTRLLRAIRKPGKDDSRDTSEVVAKSSLVGVVTSVLVSSAMRMATAYAGNQFRQYFASRGGAPEPVPPMQRSPLRKPSQPEQTHDR